MSTEIAPADLRAELRLALAEQRAHARKSSENYRASPGPRGIHGDEEAARLAKRVVALRLQLDGDAPSESRQPERVPIARATRRYNADDY